MSNNLVMQLPDGQWNDFDSWVGHPPYFMFAARTGEGDNQFIWGAR